MMAVIPEELIKEALRVNALGRQGEPEEVAEMVAFLLSEKSTYMVGACVEVTGGRISKQNMMLNMLAGTLQSFSLPC